MAKAKATGTRKSGVVNDPNELKKYRNRRRNKIAAESRKRNRKH